jgi:hypothetical protein
MQTKKLAKSTEAIEIEMQEPGAGVTRRTERIEFVFPSKSRRLTGFHRLR